MSVSYELVAYKNEFAKVVSAGYLISWLLYGLDLDMGTSSVSSILLVFECAKSDFLFIAWWDVVDGSVWSLKSLSL